MHLDTNHQLLEQMSVVSEQWTWNNVARVIGSTLYATSRLVLFRSEPDRKDYRNIAFSVIFYVMVWLTAAAPGYISNKLFTFMSIRLANIPGPQGGDGRASMTNSMSTSQKGSISKPSMVGIPRPRGVPAVATIRRVPNLQEEYSPAPQDSRGCALSTAEEMWERRWRMQQKALLLMQTASCLRGQVGMHFMGVPMTVQKAFAVGTLLSWIIASVVHAHGPPGSQMMGIHAPSSTIIPVQ
jgi:hypothetical protein